MTYWNGFWSRKFWPTTLLMQRATATQWSSHPSDQMQESEGERVVWLTLFFFALQQTVKHNNNGESCMTHTLLLCTTTNSQTQQQRREMYDSHSSSLHYNKQSTQQQRREMYDSHSSSLHYNKQSNTTNNEMTEMIVL
jgi:hypothetical protein